MRTRQLTVGLILALTAAIVWAGPASAQCASAECQAGTDVTFVVDAGLLNLSNANSDAGTAADFGTATANITGTSVQGSLGSTTVEDNRASIAGWTVDVSSTDFTGDAQTPGDATDDTTITANNASMWTLTTLPTTGIVIPTTTHISEATALALSTTDQTFLTATTLGSGTITYDPTVKITVPAGAIAGTYTGTITQSVY